MAKKLLLACLCLCIVGCTSLSTRVISVGYREQYVVNKLNKETYSMPNGYEIYEIKDSPVRAGESFSLQTYTLPDKSVTIASFKVSPEGEILEKNYANLSSPFYSRIQDSEINCLPCIKPVRYHTSEFYVAAPLLIITAPIDAMQIIIYTALIIPGLTLFISINATACALGGACH